MGDEAQPTQVLGEAGESCRECGAPLADDQRYCLNCGCRHGGPRIDFTQHPPAGSAAAGNGTAPPARDPAAPGASPVPAEKPQRDYAALAAVGGIAVLGLMLLVGVLIGRGSGDSASSPAPQVVRLGEEGGGGAGEGAGEAESGGKAGKSKSKSSGGKKKSSSAKGLTGGGPVEASDEALRELQEQSPEEYQESSAKLPDEISTGGPAPAEDNKAPGGGGKGATIE